MDGDKMKRKILYAIIAILLSSCDISGTPDLLSIGFIDDRTIECEFPLFDSNSYSVQKYSITPNNGYKIKYQTFAITKLKIYFNKDIPDGAIIELDFEDSEGNYVLTHTFVKGEESESL